MIMMMRRCWVFNIPGPRGSPWKDSCCEPPADREGMNCEFSTLSRLGVSAFFSLGSRHVFSEISKISEISCVRFFSRFRCITRIFSNSPLKSNFMFSATKNFKVVCSAGLCVDLHLFLHCRGTNVLSAPYSFRNSCNRTSSKP